MTYNLLLGDRAYSSWSLRGWLLFEHFDIPVDTEFTRFYCDAFYEAIARYAPARTVPALRLPDGIVVADSLAIAEELASRHPQAGIWPDAPRARAIARAMAAEMHSSFGALRNACPMNLRVAYADYTPDDAVRDDLRRLELIWDNARSTLGVTGPWLCGDYSAVDAFFAPVAARIAGYGLQVSPAAQTYVDAHLSDPAFRKWRAMASCDGADQPVYARDFAQRDWPGPAPMLARAVEEGTPENTACPYSGKPVTHLMKLDGRIFGFCNAFCRDKTVADAEAFPKFMNIYHS